MTKQNSEGWGMGVSHIPQPEHTTCENSLYYSLLYGTSAPCIHNILIEFWAEKTHLKNGLKEKK